MEDLSCLLRRGKPKRMAPDVMQVLMAPVGAYSVKPDETHARIEAVPRSVLRSSYLLFARV